MIPEISDFLLSSLVEMDKYIEVEDSNFVAVKQTGEVQIKMVNDNGKPFNATLYKRTICSRLV